MSERPPSDQAPAKRRGLRRREFLALGSAGVVAPWIERALGLGIAFAATPGSGTILPMSVGYLLASDGAPDFDTLLRNYGLPGVSGAPSVPPGEDPPELEPAEVIPADSLLTGEPQLSGATVRLSVLGLYPTGLEAIASCPPRADMTVWMSSTDPLAPGPFPFYAWSVRRRPALNVGHIVHFPVGLGLDGAMNLTLEVELSFARGKEQVADRAVGGLQGAPIELEERGAGSKLRRFDANFTIDPVDGLPKLQRGIYFLGLAATTWRSGTLLPRSTEPMRTELASLVVAVDPIAEEP